MGKRGDKFITVIIMNEKVKSGNEWMNKMNKKIDKVGSVKCIIIHKDKEVKKRELRWFWYNILERGNKEELNWK